MPIALMVLLHVAGAVALLLWGMHMLTTGVVRAAGARLQDWFGRHLARPASAFTAGTLITVLFQSSTATALLMASFAGQGLVPTATGLLVMLGANVGTALVAQILSFDVAAVAPLLLLTGIALFRRGGPVLRQCGRSLLGLGILLVALNDLGSALDPVMAHGGHADQLLTVLTHPGGVGAALLVWMGLFLLAATAAWICHASLVVILAGAVAASSGLLTPVMAVAVVLGANIGGAGPPVWEAIGRARAVPLGNMLARLVGAMLLAGPMIWGASWGASQLGTRWIVDMHLLFNIAVAAAAWPMNARLARWLDQRWPAEELASDWARPRYLDDNRPLADRLRDETTRLLDWTGELLGHLSLDAPPLPRAERTRFEQAVEGLGAVMRQALQRVDVESVIDPKTHALLERLPVGTVRLGLLCADTVDFLDDRERARATGWTPRPDVRVLYATLLTILSESWTLGVIALRDGDREAAQALMDRKVQMRLAHDEAERAFWASRANLTDRTFRSALEEGYVLRFLRDVRRLHSHVVALAYPVLDAQGMAPPEDDAQWVNRSARADEERPGQPLQA